MKPCLRRFLAWLSRLVDPGGTPALAAVAETTDTVVHFAALLCSHCQDIVFANALDIVLDVLVDVELPLFAGVVSVDALNVRDQPGIDGQGNPVGTVVAVLDRGDAVDVWCTRPDGWALIVWDSNGGWCSNKYLEHPTGG